MGLLQLWEMPCVVEFTPLEALTANKNVTSADVSGSLVIFPRLPLIWSSLPFRCRALLAWVEI